MDLSSPIRVKQIEEYNGWFAYPNVSLTERLKRTRSVNLTEVQLSVLCRFEMLIFTKAMIERVYPMIELRSRHADERKMHRIFTSMLKSRNISAACAQYSRKTKKFLRSQMCRQVVAESGLDRTLL